MALLNKSNIITGNIVQATDVYQIIDALAHSGSYDILISGSVSIGTGSVNNNFKTFIVGDLGVKGMISSSAVTGTFVGNGAAVTGVVSSSYALTASYTPYAASALSASYALTSSYSNNSNTSNTSTSSSYALTASYAMNGGSGGGGTLSGSGVVGYYSIWYNSSSYLTSSQFISENATTFYVAAPSVFTSTITASGNIVTTGYFTGSGIQVSSGVTASAFYQGTGSVLIASGSGSFTGNVFAAAFYQNSLKVLKENIKPFEDNAVNILNGVNVVSFNYKKHPNQFKIGFIADETHKYLSTEEQNVMDVNNTLGVLIKAIQELYKENEILKDRISKLEKIS